ncbi:WS/DGAT domain-containing protein [Nocardia sp. NBC_00565]|uniref:wax ester/triacylglycerol synthase domain-containing protein n=1 Tax=Nocardia sp. NBC_00565 TaxID=2975993 RepID=UPI002E800BE6|nr:wax ester/triacylglycerol synthase domain-containing protein [Nocardia sp. NBC_00565]WUC07722.1 WS/DGAT domain-containing protein [Nocardia sp. NBC_00565]
MHESQLVANDAAYYYFARSGRVTDWPMWWVFDSAGGVAPTATDIARHFDERAELLEPLRRRIHEVPGGLGHPFWGVDDSPIDSHIVIHAVADLDWADCLDRMGSILARPLDARVSAWQLHVFPEVSGIATLTGPGTVVMMHISHALMAGPAMTSLTEALFASAPTPLRIEGLGPAAKRPRLRLTAVGGALRWPLQMLRFNLRVRGETRRIARDGDDGGPDIPPLSPTVLNRRIGPDRAIRTIPMDLRDIRTPGITVTAVGLTAISRAMERYLEKRGEPCPDDLAALVTIAVPDAAVMGVNRVGAAAVALAPAEPDLADRARTVEATLRARRHAPSSRRELNRLQLIGLLPSRTYRTRFGTLPPADPATPAYGHTILTSIRCEPTAEWSLLGKPFRFAGMLPPVFPEIGLAHSFVGAGDTFTVSVACDPEIVPDLDDYRDILQESCHEVVTALRD